jgi:hypothetical protein
MKIDIRGRGWAMTHFVLAGLILLSLLLPLHAAAALGGDVTSVESDQKQMKAQRVVRASANYSVHELQADSSATVREYVSPVGKVFGVAWQGQAIPDLRQLLGEYYNQFDQAAAVQRKLRRRGPLVINESGLVVVSSGHMRAYSGKAYVSGLLPGGVQAEEIR